MYKLTILATLLLTLVPGYYQQTEPAVDPVVVDNRGSMDLANGIEDVIHQGNNNVDISTKRASVMFQMLENKMAELQNPSHLSHFVMNEIEGNENGQLLEEWRIGTDTLGHKIYEVIIKTLNINAENPEDRVHQQLVLFQCKFFEYYEEMICVPEHCDLTPFINTPTPGVVCAKNYRYSQELITTLYESSHTTDREDVGAGIYDLSLECMKKKIETLPVRGEEICYYEGFEPENITPLSEMEANLFADGWVRLEDGTYQRESVVESKNTDVRVDENEMTIQNKQ